MSSRNKKPILSPETKLIGNDKNQEIYSWVLEFRAGVKHYKVILSKHGATEIYGKPGGSE